MIKKDKVVIIGAGAVGAAVLNGLAQMNLVSQIILIDKNEEKAKGEILDVMHTTAFAYSSNISLQVGTYEDCKDAAMIIMSAGPSIKPGDTLDRQVLAKTNVKIFDSIMAEITKYTKEALIIVVSNPVDILVYMAQHKYNYPKDKIFGTGTLIDTARLRQLLSSKVHIDSKNIHGWVFGEHGSNCFIPWSTVNIAGVPIEQASTIFNSDIDLLEIEEETKSVGLNILLLKGFTSSGVAMSVCRIIKAILLNEQAVLPLSSVLNGEYGIEDVALSIPTIIGNQGLLQKIEVPLTKNEIQKLQDCAKALKNIITNIDK